MRPVQEIITEKARVAQGQEKCTIRKETIAFWFEAIKAEYENVTSDIAAKGSRRRELERFIPSMYKPPEVVTEFDEALRGNKVDHLTVNAKDNIVFTSPRPAA